MQLFDLPACAGICFWQVSYVKDWQSSVLRPAPHLIRYSAKRTSVRITIRRAIYQLPQLVPGCLPIIPSLDVPPGQKNSASAQGQYGDRHRVCTRVDVDDLLYLLSFDFYLHFPACPSTALESQPRRTLPYPGPPSAWRVSADQNGQILIGPRYENTANGLL